MSDIAADMIRLLEKIKFHAYHLHPLANIDKVRSWFNKEYIAFCWVTLRFLGINLDHE